MMGNWYLYVIAYLFAHRFQFIGMAGKASATVTTADFKGLHKREAVCKSRLSIGLVLYDHDKIIPFGDRLYVVPVSAIWH